ncbi:cytochrome b/b6 domain-containing protein [Microbacterium sp. NPDC056044]|uniref:cytochrome b/b6 domain-containing protein n=1 Tax=Microbacterium sp. NPDC056044 TaxID=3345690 RepID=UPI0035DAB9AF
MATNVSTLRRGLPRTPGGDPWPPAGPALASAPVADAAHPAGVDAAPAGSTTPAVVVADVDAVPQSVVAGAQVDDAPKVTAEPRAAAATRPVRRGLPRVPGGEPWPPASVAAPATNVAAVAASDAGARPDMTPSPAGQQMTPSADAKALRRGLPRVAGGEPWPPAGFAPAATVATATAAAETAVVDAASAPSAEAPAVAVAEVAASVPPAVPATATGTPLDRPLPFTRTVWAGATASTHPAAKPEPKRIGPFTRTQWAGAVIVGGAGLLYAAAMAVFAVRWLLSTEWGVDFLAAYPGEYHLPEGAPVGFPAWLGWQHFFNVFLMVLIIRSGLQVRTQQKPPAYWTPRRGGAQGKVSLTVWFHQSLDVLWVVNGLVFIVLLFVSGQWMRIVPTSWEVFPNAVSAALQYVSLDWPTENGWVNYNGLQQLAYFTTVFVAAPLAIATGVRMSGFWPKNATGLSKAYPIEWARAVHFPTMLYFVVFIAVHVFLVFATGALRNLNHMYAAQGSVDPNAYADNWTGFWLFALSLIVIAAAWVAARPLVLAPIARLFGTVSSR